MLHRQGWERSDSVAQCLNRAKHVYPSLVLVQPRKTRPYITERLLMGRKEIKSNKQILRQGGGGCMANIRTYSDTA